MSSSATPKKEPYDLVRRGVKKSNLPGSTIFIGLRSIDPFIQYGILANGLGSSLLHGLGLVTLPNGIPNTGTFLDGLGLSPYRLVLLSMAVGSSVKQIYWLLFVSQEELEPSAAVLIAMYNSLINSINSLLFTCTLTSASLSNDGRFPQTPLLVGGTMCAVGLVLEFVSEEQRKQFKKNPKNKGKLCTTGLWGFARHINYTSYAVWRSGYALAAAGWIWGGVVFSWSMYQFINMAVPALSAYCERRYGADWEEYKSKVPYKMIPYIW